MKNLFSVSILSLSISAFMFSCSSGSTPENNMTSPTEKSVDNKVTGGEENEGNEKNEENSTREGNEKEHNATDIKTSNSSDSNAKTKENMLTAFTGETTASAKYAAYSKKAESEGYHEIALLFKATSTSENIHANNHKVALEDLGVKIPTISPTFDVKSTLENLEDALKGESYEIATMYPEFIATAKATNNEFALISLEYAYKTEKKHKVLYEGAITALKNNTVKSMVSVYFVCPTCGNTFAGIAPKRCEISMTSSEKFLKIVKL